MKNYIVINNQHIELTEEQAKLILEAKSTSSSSSKSTSSSSKSSSSSSSSKSSSSGGSILSKVTNAIKSWFK